MRKRKHEDDKNDLSSKTRGLTSAKVRRLLNGFISTGNIPEFKSTLVAYLNAKLKKNKNLKEKISSEEQRFFYLNIFTEALGLKLRGKKSYIELTQNYPLKNILSNPLFEIFLIALADVYEEQGIGFENASKENFYIYCLLNAAIYDDGIFYNNYRDFFRKHINTEALLQIHLDELFKDVFFSRDTIFLKIGKFVPIISEFLKYDLIEVMLRNCVNFDNESPCKLDSFEKLFMYYQSSGNPSLENKIKFLELMSANPNANKILNMALNFFCNDKNFLAYQIENNKIDFISNLLVYGCKDLVINLDKQFNLCDDALIMQCMSDKYPFILDKMNAEKDSQFFFTETLAILKYIISKGVNLNLETLQKLFGLIEKISCKFLANSPSSLQSENDLKILLKHLQVLDDFFADWNVNSLMLGLLSTAANKILDNKLTFSNMPFVGLLVKHARIPSVYVDDLLIRFFDVLKKTLAENNFCVPVSPRNQNLVFCLHDNLPVMINKMLKSPNENIAIDKMIENSYLATRSLRIENHKLTQETGVFFSFMKLKYYFENVYVGHTIEGKYAILAVDEAIILYTTTRLEYTLPIYFKTQFFEVIDFLIERADFVKLNLLDTVRSVIAGFMKIVISEKLKEFKKSFEERLIALIFKILKSSDQTETEALLIEVSKLNYNANPRCEILHRSLMENAQYKKYYEHKKGIKLTKDMNVLQAISKNSQSIHISSVEDSCLEISDFIIKRYLVDLKGMSDDQKNSPYCAKDPISFKENFRNFISYLNDKSNEFFYDSYLQLFVSSDAINNNEVFKMLKNVSAEEQKIFLKLFLKSFVKDFHLVDYMQGMIKFPFQKNNHYYHAQRCTTLISNISRYSRTFYGPHRLIASMYLGLMCQVFSDPEFFPDQTTLHKRYELMIACLGSAIREYSPDSDAPDHPSCPKGLIESILQVLNGAHPKFKIKVITGVTIKDEFIELYQSKFLALSESEKQSALDHTNFVAKSFIGQYKNEFYELTKPYIQQGYIYSEDVEFYLNQDWEIFYFPLIENYFKSKGHCIPNSEDQVSKAENNSSVVKNRVSFFAALNSKENRIAHFFRKIAEITKFAKNEEILQSLKDMLDVTDFNINTVQEDGKTALHLAVLANHSPLVALLIEKGIDKSISDSNSKTAGDYITNETDKEIIAMIAIIAAEPVLNV